MLNEMKILSRISYIIKSTSQWSHLAYDGECPRDFV